MTRFDKDNLRITVLASFASEALVAEDKAVEYLVSSKGKEHEQAARVAFLTASAVCKMAEHDLSRARAGN